MSSEHFRHFVSMSNYYLKIFKFLLLNSIFYLILPTYTIAQVNIEKLRETKDAQGLSGYVELDISSKSGNVDITKIYLENRLNYMWEYMNAFFVVQGDFGWKDKERFSNEALAHLRHQFRVKTNLQPEFFIQVDYNKKRLLSFRGLIGSGLRLGLYIKEKNELWLGSAFMFEHESLDLDEKGTHEKVINIIRWSNYISTKLDFNNQIHLAWTAYIQPYINNFKDIRILSDTDLIIEIRKNFALATGFRIRYDSRPPDNIKSIDTALKTGLVLIF